MCSSVRLSSCPARERSAHRLERAQRIGSGTTAEKAAVAGSRSSGEGMVVGELVLVPVIIMIQAFCAPPCVAAVFRT
jgi:hypothetical protein